MPKKSLVGINEALRDAVDRLKFSAPAAFVYDPLDYAWPVAKKYLETYGKGPKEVVFLGMNPGPFGMAQTGVPFGEVSFVRDYLGLAGTISSPRKVHPKKPVLGFDSTRSEVSGRRLWGAIAKKHTTPDRFFERGFVLNYCPLLFLDQNGANLTPDKLVLAERKKLEAICDHALGEIFHLLAPKHIVGIGGYAAKRAALVSGRNVVTMPHPSPASPAANKDWEGIARASLAAAGLVDLL